MAEENEQENPAPNRKKLIIIIAAVLLLAGGGAAYFLLGSGNGEESGHGDSHEAHSEHSEHGEHGDSHEKKDAHGEEHNNKDSHEGSSDHGGGHGSEHAEGHGDKHGGGHGGGHGDAHGGEHGKEHNKTGHEEVEINISFGETHTLKPFHLNLGNPLENRFVRLEVALEYKGGTTQLKEIERRKVQLRDATLSVISRKTREFLLTPDGKDQLRLEILNRINQYMDKKIDAVYITDLLIE